MEEGKVTSTIDSYVGDIRGFLEFLESKRVNFRGNLTRIYITTYKAYLTENGYTINKKINSLHSFNFFLVSKNLYT
jgi:integrase/recombinase XerD